MIRSSGVQSIGGQSDWEKLFQVNCRNLGKKGSRMVESCKTSSPSSIPEMIFEKPAGEPRFVTRFQLQPEPERSGCDLNVTMAYQLVIRNE